MKRILLLSTLILLVALGAAGQVSVTPSKGPCYMILEELAYDKQTQRWVTGGLNVGAGVLIYLAFAPYNPTAGLVLGGIPLGVGAFTLLVPSDAERAFAEVEKEAPEARETRCDILLTKLAHSAQRSRYISAIGYAALGVSGLALGDIYTGVFGLGMASFNFLFPSSENSIKHTSNKCISSTNSIKNKYFPRFHHIPFIPNRHYRSPKMVVCTQNFS